MAERTISQMYYEDGLSLREIARKKGIPDDKKAVLFVINPQTKKKERLILDEIVKPIELEPKPTPKPKPIPEPTTKPVEVPSLAIVKRQAKLRKRKDFLEWISQFGIIAKTEKAALKLFEERFGK